MALFAAQLQPWEENQSPSPTETSDQNPYELSLARSRSSSSKSGHHKQLSSDSHSQSNSNPQAYNSKPASPINTLHRQLSGDPEAPPPAWKRRSSINSNHRTHSSGPPSASRRHPGLLMTLSTTRPQLPEQMFIHESPNSSTTDLAELGLPQPAFRRRSNASGTGLSSNRSSMHSLTSEELWKMDQEANQPDLSNPTRQAKERPLDTVRRMSKGYDLPTMSHLPGEVIWPSAMDNESPNQSTAALRSKSTTSITKIAQQSKRLTIRKRASQNQSFDTNPNEGVYLHSPNSLSRPESMIITSSAHSSTTSLNSQGFSPLKTTGNRPPSAYYSRDFLSSLAPREGGYAIAATMGNGLGAHGAMSVDERRRSQVPDRRAPMAKSAGMGRWSLDGGEHYARPYGTPSAATTASNLSAPPLTSPNVSPPVEEIHLPEGASAPYSSHHTIEEPQTSPPSLPTNPSPLSQHTHANDVNTPQGERPPAPLPLPTAANDSSAMPPTLHAAAAVATPGLKNKMSKKDLKAAKVEAAKIEHLRKVEEKAALAKAKADKKEAESRAKEEMKRKEREEKERRKAEKKAKKSLVSPVNSKPSQSQVPFPRTSAPVSAPPNSPPRRVAQSMPLGTTPPSSRFIGTGAGASAGNGNGGQSVRTKASESTLKTSQSKPKLGFLGTLKKRFSGPSTSLADVRRRHESDAANIGSMPPPPSTLNAGPPATPKEVRTSSMAAAAFNTPPPAQDFAPSSLFSSEPATADAPLELAPVLSTSEELSSPQTNTAEEERSTSTLIPQPTVLAPTPSPVGSPSSRSLAKVQSRDQASVRSSHSRTRSRSASLHGPRPMPITRPESIIIAPSQPEPTLLNGTNNNNGFPFRPVEIATPTTSAESSMFSTSNGSQGHASGGSPFTSIDSRKNSLDGAAALDQGELGVGGEELERQDSTTPKASDETETRRAVLA